MATPQDENGERKVQATGRPKKPYVTPELIVHGSVEKITEQKQGSGNWDGGGMNNPYQYSG
jgi:hypothetical protein